MQQILATLLVDGDFTVGNTIRWKSSSVPERYLHQTISNKKGRYCIKPNLKPNNFMKIMNELDTHCKTANESNIGKIKFVADTAGICRFTF